jgi:hypothetical protein
VSHSHLTLISLLSRNKESGSSNPEQPEANYQPVLPSQQEYQYQHSMYDTNDSFHLLGMPPPPINELGITSLGHMAPLFPDETQHGDDS